MAMLRFAGLQIHHTAKIASHVFIGGPGVEVGEDVFINIHCFLDGNSRITIGDCVHVGPYTKFLTGTHTINPGVLRRKGQSKNINLPIEVKRGVWVGLGAIILPGVTIEEGCVIGAGSVVIHSTEPNGLYVGSPAKRIKDLPTEPA
jgi:acetyltransferase-like isoleucine patch superfamily enzyme